MSKIYIGTSGWVYSDWEGVFYPKKLSSNKKLEFFSKRFKTTEVNYSFYHLPKPSTYKNWYSQTPGDFLFAIKASRYITHTCLPARQVKRLKGAKLAWKTFLKNALELKEKLGPILFQFSPSFKATEENIKRLEKFLKFRRGRTSTDLRLAFEFRHESWCDKKIYNLLKKHNAVWVIANSPDYPKAEVVTADFVYIRMHGSKALFSSKYNKQELRSLAQKIKKWQRNGDVFVYFNNDAQGYAVQNAKELRKELSSMRRA